MMFGKKTKIILNLQKTVMEQNEQILALEEELKAVKKRLRDIQDKSNARTRRYRERKRQNKTTRT